MKKLVEGITCSLFSAWTQSETIKFVSYAPVSVHLQEAVIF